MRNNKSSNGWFYRFQSQLNNLLIEKHDSNIIDIQYWKQKNFLLAASVYLVGGLPLMLTGAYLFYLDGYITYAYIQTIFSMITAFFMIRKSYNAQFRSFVLLMFLLSVSFAVMFYASFISAGMILLLATIFLASLLLNESELKKFLSLNFFVSLVITFLLYTNQFDHLPIVSYKQIWIFHLLITQITGIGFSLIALNMHTSISIAYQNMLASIQLSELNKQRFNSSIDNSPVPTIIYDQNGIIVSSNPAWERVTGFTLYDIQNVKQWLDRALALDDLSSEELLSQLLTTQENHFNGIITFKTNYDKKISLAIYTSNIGSNEEGNVLLLTVGIDLTEQLKLEKISNSILETSKDAFFLLNIDGKILNVNDTACVMFGHTRENLIGSNIKAFDSKNQHYLAEQLRIVREKGYHRFETKHLRRDGEIIDIDISANNIYTNDSYIYLFIRDVTEKNRQMEQVLYVSTHDSLTNTFNRHYIQSYVSNLNYGEIPCSIMFFDINGIKYVNDSFGYETGDLLIQTFAKILEESIRSNDILARTGASEFMIYIEGSSQVVINHILDHTQFKTKEYNDATPENLKHINYSYGYAHHTRAKNMIELQYKAQQHLTSNKLAEKRSLRNSLLNSIVTTLSEKSHETKEHASRLSELSVAMGKRLNMAEHHISELKILAILHDIGKIGIPESILNKPGTLTPQEWEIMKKHPEIGYRIALASGELEQIANYILYHHERWDGQGYPKGLSGEDIPLPSRIIAIVDTYDAMTSDRVYRKKLTHEVAIDELRKNAHSQFDAQLVEIFVEIIEDYIKDNPKV
jgi:diguanylate cyclase (GGDEF)-like protein/PAS domain S-box-containing protein